MNTCPCGYGLFSHPTAEPWSADWHRAHRDHHLATFPDVDQGTRDNLATFIEQAS